MKYLPRFRHVLFASALFLTGALAGHAQTTISTSDVPRTISYQGLLSSTDGTPFTDGQYQVTVTLYTDAQGSGAIWQDSYTAQVSGGVFNLYLGQGKPLPSPEMMNAPLWIGTAVNGTEEMRPLTPLTASPYAFNVPDKAITGSKIADNSITAAKLDLDYVSEVQVNGEKVSAKGTVLNLVGTPNVPLTYDEATQSLTIGKAAARTGDREKGATMLANQDQVWSANGDGWDIPANIAYIPAAGDWIGTSGLSAADFELKTGGITIMRYKQAADPNIEGGNGSLIGVGSLGSTISGGQSNTINGSYSTIGGGQINTVSSPHSTIGGGDGNTIAAGHHHSAIGGGWGNFVDQAEAVIAGGHNNRVESYASGILVGHDNIINTNSMFSAIGGGQSNIIHPNNMGAVIGGGQNNRIGPAGGGNAATIGGGQDNEASAPLATVGGGGGNRTLAPEGTIAGGHNNRVEDYVGTVAGGHDNVIMPGGNAGFVGGGRDNHVTAPSGAIGGGNGNRVNNGSGFVGGGDQNRVTGINATIGGGAQNNAQGDFTTIPGGQLLTTNNSYAQSAMGFYNAPRGGMVNQPTAAQIAVSNDPLFMVGNGDITAGALSNAFEVSYNGHSTVYGVNGSGTVNPSITGATYVDNIIYAWGDIDASGAINADFGVSAVAAGGGVYVITINVTDPLGNPITLTQASITATIADDWGQYRCADITSSRIGIPGPNQFTIRTYSADCGPMDIPFMFKVTGRP